MDRQRHLADAIRAIPWVLDIPDAPGSALQTMRLAASDRFRCRAHGPYHRDLSQRFLGREGQRKLERRWALERALQSPKYANAEDDGTHQQQHRAGAFIST